MEWFCFTFFFVFANIVCTLSLSVLLVTINDSGGPKPHSQRLGVISGEQSSVRVCYATWAAISLLAVSCLDGMALAKALMGLKAVLDLLSWLCAHWACYSSTWFGFSSYSSYWCPALSSAPHTVSNCRAYNPILLEVYAMCSQSYTICYLSYFAATTHINRPIVYLVQNMFSGKVMVLEAIPEPSL